MTAAGLVLIALSFSPTTTIPHQPVEPTALAPAPLSTSDWTGTISLPNGIPLDFTVSLTPPTGTISIPMQGATDIPLTSVEVSGDQIRFTLAPAGAPEASHARFSLSIAADGTASGQLNQSGMQMPVKMRPKDAAEPAASTTKPQDPTPPYPYAEIEVTFPNPEAEGVTLAGTLTVPLGPGPHPVAILVSGSGPQDRNESLLGHRPFLVLADHLTRHNIAVLRYDDRGVGASTGDFSTATTYDFASDARAAAAYLAARPEIDPARIGVIGHSEGGLIAPIVAAEVPSLAFIVLMAGPGMSGLELMPRQLEEVLVAGGLDREAARELAVQSAHVLAMVARGDDQAAIDEAVLNLAITQIRSAPGGADLTDEAVQAQAQAAVAQSGFSRSEWFRQFLNLDPTPYLSRITCPVLAINGSLDTQVPAFENLARIKQSLEKAGHAAHRTVEYPGLNHLFQSATTGSPSEYSQIQETIAPVVLDDIAAWINETVGIAP